MSNVPPFAFAINSLFRSHRRIGTHSTPGRWPGLRAAWESRRLTIQFETACAVKVSAHTASSSSVLPLGKQSLECLRIENGFERSE